MMAKISDSLKKLVHERAKACCEYCQMQKIVVVFMEIDHIIPESRGGETIDENLCLACAGCNGFKLDYQTGIDNLTGEEIERYNPRKQIWTEHFQWSEDSLSILGISPRGRATVERLKMNREEIIKSRRLWVKAGWHPPKIK